MKLTKEQIEAIEKTADSLQRWGDGSMSPELKMLGCHGQLIVMVQKQIDMVAVDLLAQMSEVGKLVQDKFQNLIKQAKLVDSLDADAAYFEIENARLHGLARQLADTLQRIAQNASELSYEKPAEADSQQRKIGFLSELTPDEKRNEQRK